MRNEQFSEIVKRSLTEVSSALEHDETQYFLEENINDVDDAFYSNNTKKEFKIMENITNLNILRLKTGTPPISI